MSMKILVSFLYVKNWETLTNIVTFGIILWIPQLLAILILKVSQSQVQEYGHLSGHNIMDRMIT